MAVSMNAGGNFRADFMISDAALPLRIEEIAEEQSGMFAQLLSDIGDAKGDLAAEVEKVVQKYSDMKQAGEAAVYRDKETGKILPEDPRKLAKLILKGKVKLQNVPEELITPELMKLLMLMKKADEFGGDEDDDEEDEDLTYAIEAIAAEQKFQKELSNSMLMELYQIIEKHNERESEDKVTMLDGISEPIDATQTLPSVVTADEEPAVGESMFTELIDNLVEMVSEGLEIAEEAAEEVIPVETVPSETVVESTEEVPVEVNAEQIASEVSDVNVSVEQPVMVQATVSQNEQSAETAAQQTIPVEEFSMKTVKTEVTPQIAENAAKPESEESIAVKVVTRNENAEQLDKTVSEEPKSVADARSRVKSAADELAMLKKAKADGKTVEEKPMQTAQPLNADSPIVFKRADGSEFEVRPSEIVRQTTKLVEEAITSSDDKTEYSLVLNPEELGRITVKLTKAADGAVSITIAAENARTQRILEQHSESMQDNLRSNGLNLESWQTVGERQQETAAQDYNGSSKNPYFRNDDNNSEENPEGGSFADIIAAM